MGRPVILPGRREVSFAASAETVELLREKAAREETTPSDIIRRALRAYFAQAS